MYFCSLLIYKEYYLTLFINQNQIIMKKILSIIMVVALCTSVMAQQAHIAKKTAVNKASVEKTVQKSQDRGTNQNETVPALRQSFLMPSDGDINMIGETYYNLPTNGNARNMVSFRQNSDDAAAVWTIAFTNTTRGTGINYFNVTENKWRDAPDPATGRIETVRTGWGGHAFTTNGEVVVAHDGSTALVVNTRDNWGTGAWTQSLLKAPPYTANGAPSTCLLWPSVCAVGNTVHLIAVTEDNTGGNLYFESDFPNTSKWGYKGYVTYPLYYRSTDGGKTWGAPVDFGPDGGLGLLTPYETFKINGDSYVIAAKGDHVVILFSTLYGFVFYLESLDGGNTWEKKTVYHVGELFVNTATEELDLQALPRSGAIAIDEKDNVHVAFSSVINSTDLTSGQISVHYALPVGLFYWNDSMPQYDNKKMFIEVDELNDTAIWHYEDLASYLHLPSVIGFDELKFIDGGPAYDYDQFGDNGWAPFVRLFAKDEKVYIAYQAPLDPPINFQVGDEIYCQGIFVTVSEDNGKTWDVQKNTSWISYSPDLLWLNWDAYTEDEWPVYDPETGEWSWSPGVLDAAIEIITENAYPTMSYNEKDNSIMLEWLNHFTTPFPNDGTVFESDPITVLTMTQRLEYLPCFNNIDYIFRSKECAPCSDVFPQVTTVCDNSFCKEEDTKVLLKWKKPCLYGDVTTYIIYKDSIEIARVDASTFQYTDGPIEEGVTEVTYMVATNIDDSMSPERKYVIESNTNADCIQCGDGVKNIPAPIVKIYPNPTNGEVIFDINANDAYTLTITNIMGQEITSMNGNTNRVSLNVSNYASGVYFVTVKTANAMTTQKLIVK